MVSSLTFAWLNWRIWETPYGSCVGELETAGGAAVVTAVCWAPALKLRALRLAIARIVRYFGKLFVFITFKSNSFKPCIIITLAGFIVKLPAHTPKKSGFPNLLDTDSCWKFNRPPSG